MQLVTRGRTITFPACQVRCPSSHIMGSSDKFCLRWNEFESNISAAFGAIRDDGDFFDVRLACEDGSKQIPAHRYGPIDLL